MQLIQRRSIILFMNMGRLGKNLNELFGDFNAQFHAPIVMKHLIPGSDHLPYFFRGQDQPIFLGLLVQLKDLGHSLFLHRIIQGVE
ncbi:hypothetical protein D3C81_2071400 [compost metagenome]